MGKGKREGNEKVVSNGTILEVQAIILSPNDLLWETLSGANIWDDFDVVGL